MFAWFTDALSNPKSKIKIVDKTKSETYFNAAGKSIWYDGSTKILFTIFHNC